jgi:HAD superfamily hydrolase (TIGR01484 family)
LAIPDPPAGLGHLAQGAKPIYRRTLLAVDIDGTLLAWDGTLPPSSAAAVTMALADDSVEVVLATGRSLHSTLRVAERLGISHGWAVCSNGSVTVRFDPDLPRGWELIECVTFDASRAIRAIRRRLPDARLAIEDLGRGFLVTAPFPSGELDGEVRVVDAAELAATPATRVVLRDTEADLDQLAQIVEETRLPDATYAIGWTGWVDLNPPGVSKASALEVVRQQLAIDPDSTVAVGDGGNDITMLRWAARGVAMGGSRPEVVAAADEVTSTLEEDGLAKVIDSVLSRTWCQPSAKMASGDG